MTKVGEERERERERPRGGKEVGGESKRKGGVGGGDLERVNHFSASVWLNASIMGNLVDT